MERGINLMRRGLLFIIEEIPPAATTPRLLFDKKNNGNAPKLSS